MKKIISMIMVFAMLFAFSGCGSKENAAGGESTGTDSAVKIDMSAYPANFEEWTIDNMMAYLKEAGVCTKDEWLYVQNEDECMPAETGISKVGSYMSDDEEGQQVLMIFYFDPNASQSAVKEQIDYIRKNKTCDQKFDNQPIDHTVGNFAFCYSVTSLDDEFVTSMDKAFENLVSEFKLEASF